MPGTLIISVQVFRVSHHIYEQRLVEFALAASRCTHYDSTFRNERSPHSDAECH